MNFYSSKFSVVYLKLFTSSRSTRWNKNLPEWHHFDILLPELYQFYILYISLYITIIIYQHYISIYYISVLYISFVYYISSVIYIIYPQNCISYMHYIFSELYQFYIISTSVHFQFNCCEMFEVGRFLGRNFGVSEVTSLRKWHHFSASMEKYFNFVNQNAQKILKVI